MEDPLEHGLGARFVEGKPSRPDGCDGIDVDIEEGDGQATIGKSEPERQPDMPAAPDHHHIATERQPVLPRANEGESSRDALESTTPTLPVSLSSPSDRGRPSRLDRRVKARSVGAL